MQARRRALCTWRRNGLPALIRQIGFRSFTSTTDTLQGHEGATAAADLPPWTGPDNHLHLRSVFRVQEGCNTFAAATVTFGQVADGPVSNEAAQHAAQVALLALRGALGSHAGPQRSPSALAVLASVDLPAGVLQGVVERLAGQLTGEGTAVLGCSSRLRLPDEWLRPPPPAPSSSSSSGPAQAPPLPSGSQPYHVTLAAAHLPEHEVHVVYSETSSLPRLPHLAEALQGRRPPAFLALSSSDTLAAEMLKRLENLFPGSCVGAGVSSFRGSLDVRAMMEAAAAAEAGGSSNSSTSGGGGGRGGWMQGLNAGSAVSAAGFPGLEEQAAAAGVTGLGGRGSGGPASELEGHFQRMLLDREDPSSGTPGSDAASSSSNTASTSSISSSSSVGGGTAGRRRRAPSTAAAAAASAQPAADTPGKDSSSSAAPSHHPHQHQHHGDGSTTRGSSPGANGGSGGGAVDITAQQQHLEEAASSSSSSSKASPDLLGNLRPPLVMVGDRVHTKGCGLLAIYPKPVPRTEEQQRKEQEFYQRLTRELGAGGGGGGAGGGGAVAALRVPVGPRLSSASCDRLARVMLGTDSLHHVSLRSAALSAISPPPTGPEPGLGPEEWQPAPDNPYYWWPGVTAMPHSSTLEDLYDIASPGPTTGVQDAAAGAATAAADGGGASAAGRAPQTGPPGGREAASVETEATELAAAGAVEGQDEAAEEGRDGDVGEEAGEEDDGFCPSAAALAALSEGLSDLPLFPLDSTLLFPGQTMHLHVFEKRYRLLMRACLEQGAAFGLCWQGMGCTAVVRSYQCTDGDATSFRVLLEGGVRFAYTPADLDVTPASYGVNVAKHAEYVVDDPPASDEEWAATVQAAHTAMDLIVGALEAAKAPPAQHAARTFANALHFASSQQQPAGSSSSSASNTSASTTETTASSNNPATSTSDRSSSDSDNNNHSSPVPEGNSSESSSSSAATGAATTTDAAAGSETDADAALLASDVAEAKRVLDGDTASLLSLYLAPHIPIHQDSVRRQWFSTRKTLWRLQQEVSRLHDSPRTCRAVATSILRLPRDHPLRVMMGLSRVAPVG